jgi:hypothetical protein
MAPTSSPSPGLIDAVGAHADVGVGAGAGVCFGSGLVDRGGGGSVARWGGERWGGGARGTRRYSTMRSLPRTRSPARSVLASASRPLPPREFGINESDGAPDEKECRPKHEPPGYQACMMVR